MVRPVLAAAAVLAVLAPAPSPAAAAPEPGTPALSTIIAPPTAIRLRPRPTFRTRPAYRPRTRTYARRAPSLRHVGGAILRALGIAYLMHLFFGWGGGGSPLGLLLLAIMFWLVSRTRRRRSAYAARW